MPKRLIALMVPLCLSPFVAGCPQPRPEPIQPAAAQTVEIETHKPEPNEVGLPTVPLPNVDRPTPEPKQPEPPPMKPSEPEPNEVTPVEAEPLEAEVPVAEPNEAEVGEIEPAATQPETTEPNEVERGPVETKQSEPNQVQPTQAEPNDTGRSPRVSFHEKCAGILNEFVDKNGMVDYSKLRRQRLRLKSLLDEFDALDPSEYKAWLREDKIAFWINAYNVQMLNIIASNYPIEASRWLTIFYGPYSILHIKGIWTDYKFMVMDEEFTLSAIEQRFFRKEFHEPRVFLALSRASLSSPALRNEPYYGDRLDQQLDEQAKKFLSSPYGFKIDRAGQTVYLSVMFEPKPSWYGGEFADKYGTDKKFKDQQPTTRAVLNFITNYIPQGDISFLEVENYSVKYMKYDWTLNDSSIKQ
jgi:hypothetical protein